MPKKIKFTKQNLVTVAEYAKLAGITAMAVSLRVEAGTLKYAKKSPVFLIDLNAYPAKRLKLGRRPYRTAISA